MKNYLRLILPIFFLTAFSLAQAAPVINSFTTSTTSGDLPLEVDFNVSASGTGTLSYYWTFGDGNSAGPAGTSITHTYNSTGTFPASIVVLDATGSTFAQVTITVNIPSGTYTITLDAVHDAHLNGGVRTNSTQLKVGDGNTTYLKYNIPKLPGHITQAELQLAYDAYPSANSTVNVAKGSNTNWTEGNLSNTNKPSNIGNIGDINTYSSGQFQYTKDIPISNVVEQEDLNFILTSSILHVFQSEEITTPFPEDKPKLILTVDHTANDPPDVSFDSPLDNTVFQIGEVKPVIANACDSDGTIVEVTLSMAGFSSTKVAPDAFSWPDESFLRNLSPSLYSMQLTATDNDGATTSTWIYITVNAPPQLGFYTPSNGMVYQEGDVKPVEVDGDDDHGISHFDLYLDDVLIAANGFGWPDNSTLRNLTPGTYEIKVVATDTHGATAEATRTIIVEAVPAPPSAPAVQTATANVVTSNTNDWDQVTFPTAFDETPIVVIGPPSFNNAQQSTTRVRNVTQTGFEVQVDEWDYLDGGHPSETITYIAAKSGTHDLNGVTMIAGEISNVKQSWKTSNYSTTFSSTPVVLATQITDIEEDATVVRIRNTTTTNFQLRLQEQELNPNAHVNETVHFMAFSKGTGDIDGKNIKVDDTGRSVEESWKTISYGGTYNTTGFVAAMQTTYGGDACALRYQNLSSTSVQVKVEEEQSANSEVNHTTETVGYVVIQNTATMPVSNEEETNPIEVVEERSDEINTLIKQELVKIYPNPATDILHITNAQDATSLELYNIAGKLVKQYDAMSKETISVSDLQSGMYIIIVHQEGGQQTLKFIKE